MTDVLSATRRVGKPPRCSTVTSPPGEGHRSGLRSEAEALLAWESTDPEDVAFARRRLRELCLSRHLLVQLPEPLPRLDLRRVLR